VASSRRCARGNVIVAASAHSQNPVTVLHTDPTQLEQLSEHGHPLGIVRGPLQPGGMIGQLLMVVEVVVLVDVVVVLEVVDVVVDDVVDVVVLGSAQPRRTNTHPMTSACTRTSAVGSHERRERQ
jgi:hypothetical protein